VKHSFITLLLEVDNENKKLNWRWLYRWSEANKVQSTTKTGSLQLHRVSSIQSNMRPIDIV